MLIDRVTFTGADDSVTPAQLARVQEECPRIEWGILLSKSMEGKGTRFPSRNWLDNLAKREVYLPMLSGHLGGRWVRELIAGRFTYREERPNHFAIWHRMQLNFHGERLEPVEAFYWQLASCHDEKTFIFQIDGVNDWLYYAPDEPSDDPRAVQGGAMAHGLNALPLLDNSHGEGLLPERWIPIPHREVLTGYAGGLGPANLADELKRIEDAVGEGVIWIDFETRVRSDDDILFDLDKCRRCYDIAQQWLRPKEE
jgi:hypothetical protein